MFSRPRRARPSNEVLARAIALQWVLAACKTGRYPADPALITSLERVASRAALWGAVAAEHPEAA